MSKIHANLILISSIGLVWVLGASTIAGAQAQDFTDQEFHRKMLKDLREEKKRMAKLELGPWQERASGWIAIRFEGQLTAEVLESDQIVHIEAKGASIEGDHDDGWRIRFAKKPKSMKLFIPLRGAGDKGKGILCDLKAVLQEGSGYLGVFALLDGGFHCLGRAG